MTGADVPDSAPAPGAGTAPGAAPDPAPVSLGKDHPGSARTAGGEPPLDTEAAAPGAPVDRRTWLLVGALAVVVALLAVASLVLVGKERTQDRRAERAVALAAVQDPSGPALRAAATAAETLLSYDYTRLDADFAAGRELLTPEFADKYGEFTDKLVRPPALQARARVVARVQVLAPTEATTARQAVVLAFVDQTTTSALLQDPALDQSRVTLTLVPVDGRWLVSDLVVTGSRPGSS